MADANDLLPAARDCIAALLAQPSAAELDQASAVLDRLERQLEAERLAAIEQAEREYQMRLPMAPLPHCAGQPRSLARASARLAIQLELQP